MNKDFLLLCVFGLLLSCSHINRESRDYYRNKNFRHGIVPLSSGTVKKLNEASIARGKVLYQKNCLSCHGETGQGDGPAASLQESSPANLRKLSREVPNFQFFMSISQWQGTMPGWKEKFNPAEREDLAAYIKTFK